jgi:hypothetical protein
MVGVEELKSMIAEFNAACAPENHIVRNHPTAMDMLKHFNADELEFLRDIGPELQVALGAPVAP